MHHIIESLNKPIKHESEYNMLWDYLYRTPIELHSIVYNDLPLHSIMEMAFPYFSVAFRRRRLTLEEYDKEYCFNFDRYDEYYGNFDEVDLIRLCEYMYNLINEYESLDLQALAYKRDFIVIRTQHYKETIMQIMQELGFDLLTYDGLSIFVPKHPEVLAVSEYSFIPNDLKWRMLMYNHHSSRGDLFAKKNVIRDCADLLEPQKNKLAKIDVHFKKDLFCLFNNINIRHNNADLAIDDKEQEHWYDITYRMCLIAFLLLEHEPHKAEIKELRKKLEQK